MDGRIDKLFLEANNKVSNVIVNRVIDIKCSGGDGDSWCADDAKSNLDRVAISCTH